MTRQLYSSVVHEYLFEELLNNAHIVPLPFLARLHVEPISDMLFTESLLLTADHSGQIKTWSRPPADELLRRSLGPHNSNMVDR